MLRTSSIKRDVLWLGLTVTLERTINTEVDPEGNPLNFPSLYDNFLKKLVSEIQKCRPLQGGLRPLSLLNIICCAGADMFTRSSCTLLTSQILCDNFVKKLISEIR